MVALVITACDEGNDRTRAGAETTVAEDQTNSGNPAGWPRRHGRRDEIVGETDFVLITSGLREVGLFELAGFALKGEEVTSPGPMIRLPEGEEVTITLETWAISPCFLARAPQRSRSPKCPCTLSDRGTRRPRLVGAYDHRLLRACPR